MSSKTERNHYDLKEMENTKNANIVSIAWYCFDLIMFWLKCLLLQKNQLFYTKKSSFWPMHGCCIYTHTYLGVVLSCIQAV